MTAVSAWTRIPAMNPPRKSPGPWSAAGGQNEASRVFSDLLQALPGQPMFTCFVVPPWVVCRVQRPGDVLVGQDRLQHPADEQDLCAAGVQSRGRTLVPSVAGARPAGVAGFLAALGVVQRHRTSAAPAGDHPFQHGLGRSAKLLRGVFLSFLPGPQVDELPWCCRSALQVHPPLRPRGYWG